MRNLLAIVKPPPAERLMVIGLLASAGLCAGCVTILWGWAMDSSAATTLTGLAALMFAVSLAVRLPRRAAWGVQRLLGWLQARQTATAPPALAFPVRQDTGESRALARLLGLSAALAALGAVLSILLLPILAATSEELTRRFLWTEASWTITKGLLQFLGAFPLALGLSVLLLATGLIRQDRGRDGFASALRDWTWGACLASAALALAWWAGANLLIVLSSAVAVLVLAATMLLWRAGSAMRPRRFAAEAEPWGLLARRATTIGGFAAAAVAMLVQLRFLCDIWSVGLAGQAAWAAMSLAALTGFMGRCDARSRAASSISAVGSVIGLVCGWVMQSALAMTCLWAQDGGRSSLALVSAALAAAAQIPLTALLGNVLSRQRRLFATAGGTPRIFLADAAGGAGAGVVFYTLALAVQAGGWLVPVLTLGVLAGGALRGMRLDPTGRAARAWAAIGAVLCCSVAATLLVPRSHLSRRIVAISPGVNLSSIIRRDADGLWRLDGYLPFHPTWRGPGVSAALEEIAASAQHRGRWWVLSASDGDIPTAQAGVSMTLSAQKPQDRRGALNTDATAIDSPNPDVQRRNFDAILMCPVPADCPQAWRFYNDRALRKHLRRLRDGGCLMVRYQVSLNHWGKALAVAKTFHEAVGSGWAIVETTTDRADWLLVGPESAAAPPSPREEVFVVALPDLWKKWPWITPIRATSPSNTGRDEISPATDDP